MDAISLECLKPAPEGFPPEVDVNEDGMLSLKEFVEGGIARLKELGLGIPSSFIRIFIVFNV